MANQFLRWIVPLAALAVVLSALQGALKSTPAADSDQAELLQGTWLYDGTNLKRRCTLVNGKPLTLLHVPFATFQVTFESRNDFIGVDHVHGIEVRYERVAPGTQP